MMSQDFKLHQLLPRHTRKLLNAKNHALPIPNYASKGQLALDKNESSWGTIGVDEDYSRFPDAKTTVLREELAEFKQVRAEQMVLGNGADELLDLLIRSFCTPGKDHILAFAPYEQKLRHYACLSGVTVDEVSLNSLFQLSIFQARSHVKEQTKIMYIANPNPISGNLLRGIDIVDLVEDFNGLVVIDESYIDFSLEHSLLEYLNTYPNLVIVQSFSYAWGMAGLRLGAAYASEAIIEILQKVKPAFTVNTVAQQVAIRAIRVPEQRDRIVAEVAVERNRLRDQLQLLKFVQEVLPSETNFLLIRVDKVELLLDYLRDEGIEAYDASALYNCQNCIRITVGLPTQNQKFLKAMRDMPAKTSPARVFIRRLGKSLQKASMFLGFFKKIVG